MMTARPTTGRNRLLLPFACLAALALLAAVGWEQRELRGQQPPPAAGGEADSLTIVVESVSGTVYYVRPGEARQRVRLETQLAQGDRVYAHPGSICKLEFQQSETREVTSATIIRGYSDVEITRAFQQGQSTSTLLDVRQGVIRAGVVRSAVPPSFRIRTPHSVVAVRGTEIAELEASNDRGDHLKMGVVGSVMSNDAVPLFRSAQQQQETLIRTAGDRRGGKLLRAIEVAILKPSRLTAGPHRGGFEVDFARRHLISRPFVFNSGEQSKREGNLNRGRMINGGGRSFLIRPPRQMQSPIFSPPGLSNPQGPSNPGMEMSSPPMDPVDPVTPPGGMITTPGFSG